MANPEGICNICGRLGKLSFEHVPPNKAFNDKPVLVAKGRQLFQGLQGAQLKTRENQRGVGGYTLCVSCNNDTGGWYGRAYVDWIDQVVSLLLRVKDDSNLITCHFSIHPLRVFKQIIAMFFSVNSPRFRTCHPYLEQFVLNKEIKNLPPNIRLYAGITSSLTSRSVGVSGLLRGSDGMVFSEIAFTPFVFVLTFDSECPDSRLFDMTHLASYSYGDEAPLDMTFPLLYINTAYPADYRKGGATEL